MACKSRELRRRLIEVLKLHPTLYNLVANIYYTFTLLHLKELFIGTGAIEKYWATRDIAKGYWDIREHPMKHYLAERLETFSPIKSILEVGCASGANLYLFAKRFPHTKCVGIDINREAVEFGNAKFAQEGITNIKLIVGKADALGILDNSFEIVFTNALLVYIGADKIKKVIAEMLHVCQSALILVELHHFKSKHNNALGFYHRGNWIRDYQSLLEQFVPKDNIHITKIPKGLWAVAPWQENGAIVEVVKRHICP